MAKFKVTLDTGKIVVLEDVTVKTKNLAIEVASTKTTGTGAGFNSTFQDELLRLCIVSIDGKNPSAIEREDFDKLFAFKEYSALTLTLQDLIGGADVKKPKIEILTGNS